jgi:hypothetical protein
MTLPITEPANPFSVAGKFAIVVRATGAFGQVVRATHDKTGANVGSGAGIK